MKAIVTVLGKDRTGIIYHVSKVLYEKNANIEDVSETVMQDNIFTMVMVVDISNINCDFSELKEELKSTGIAIGMNINIQQEDIFEAMYSL